MSDKDYEQVMAYLHAHSQVHGAASVRTGDGQIIMITDTMLETLTRQIQAGREYAIIFVKHGSKEGLDLA